MLPAPGGLLSGANRSPWSRSPCCSSGNTVNSPPKSLAPRPCGGSSCVSRAYPGHEGRPPSLGWCWNPSQASRRSRAICRWGSSAPTVDWPLKYLPALKNCEILHDTKDSLLPLGDQRFCPRRVWASAEWMQTAHTPWLAASSHSRPAPAPAPAPSTLASPASLGGLPGHTDAQKSTPGRASTRVRGTSGAGRRGGGRSQSPSPKKTLNTETHPGSGSH